MPNNFLTDNSGAIAQLALATLNRLSVLPALVHRDLERDFRAGVGATVNIRKPGTLPARKYTQALRTANTPIVLDNVTETTVPVVIDQYAYSAVEITDEDATLNMRNFGEQVLVPQVQTVSEQVETDLATTVSALPATNDVTVKLTASSTAAGAVDPLDGIVNARTFLSKQKVPMVGRVLVMGADFTGRLLKEPGVNRADAAGTDTALRQAQLNSHFGFSLYESLAVPAGEAFAFSRDAVALATVTPVAPRGASASANVVGNGVTLRWLSDYDAAYLRDRSIVSVMYGSKILDPNRIVRLKLSAT